MTSGFSSWDGSLDDDGLAQITLIKKYTSDFPMGEFPLLNKLLNRSKPNYIFICSTNCIKDSHFGKNKFRLTVFSNGSAVSWDDIFL